MDPLTVKKYFRIYSIEPLGKLLIERLKLPKTLIASIFAFLYFGILLILHNVYGHPQPVNIKELFSHPSDHYYYPNLIGISFDLIGNPLFFVFLVAIRDFIPMQFAKLEQDNLIEEKHTTSIVSNFTGFVAHNHRVQIFIISAVPFIVSSLIAIQSVFVFRPQGLPEKYAIFLSFIGNYVKIVIIVQLIYALLVANSYTYKPRLHLSHPDNCSGIAPFGNIAIIMYGFIFFLAVFQAIGVSAGGSALERAITDMGASIALVYIWLLFPIAIIFIFTSFVYPPHIKLRELQTKYLTLSSEAWTGYHQNISSSIKKLVKESKIPLTGKVQYNFSYDLDILRAWSNLDQDVLQMHTWPISKVRFRILAGFVNPIIPILLPIIFDLVRSFFS